MTGQVPQPSPAGPNLSHADWVTVAIALTRKRRSEAEDRVLDRINGYLTIRGEWAADAHRRKLETLR